MLPTSSSKCNKGVSQQVFRYSSLQPGTHKDRDFETIIITVQYSNIQLLVIVVLVVLVVAGFLIKQTCKK